MNRPLPLAAVLGLLALGTAIVRVIAQWQVTLQFTGAFTSRTLLVLETGNWLGWVLWGLILSAASRRLRDEPTAAAWSVRAALALAPLALVPLFSSPVHWFATDSSGIHASAAHIMGHNLPTNLLLGVAMMAVTQGRLSRDRTRRLEQATASLRVQLAETELAMLRARLDPHFLFNALNSATVLARRGDGSQVEHVLTRLAALLRHSLDAAGTQLVPLRVELEALGHYLGIEQVRFGERLAVEVSVPDGVAGRLVPSLVLQPIVENAIHHGFTDATRTLTVSVRATRLPDDSLELRVEDDGEGLTMDQREAPPERIGLGHTRARLAGLYGGAASLTLAPAPGGRGACVTIVLPPARDGSAR